MTQKGGCRVHVGSTSSSVYALRFYDIIRNLESTRAWYCMGLACFPHDKYNTHRMHIDASVFCGTTCTRFEIDEEIRCKHSGTTRSDIDKYKDFVLCKHRVGMVRLHYIDVDKWPGYAHHALHNVDKRLTCTGSYTQCLHPDEHCYVIKL
jgi:hypothetical protein